MSNFKGKNANKKTTSLSLLDRIMIPSILKKESDYKTQILNKDINNKIALTQSEFQKFDIQVNEIGGLKWNVKGAQATFDVEFTDMEKAEIKSGLVKLDEEKKLTVDLISLYDKFVN